MDPRSEVILRQQHLLTGRVLIVNAQADGLSQQLAQQCQIQHWTWHAGDLAALQQHDLNVHFGVEMQSLDVDQVILFIPKSKTLLAYLLHHLASKLQAGCECYVVGEKKGGIESAAKLLKAYGKTVKLDSARHCQLWQLSLEKTVDAKPLEDWVIRYEIEYDSQKRTICALPGVFSQKHLDIGTAVLLPFLAQVRGKRIADFGCGAGVISLCMALQRPNTLLYALDVDAFALASTELTLQANAIVADRYQLCAITGIADAPHELDAIVSNPPFHQGIHTHYSATEDLCRESAQHLKSHGQLLIVANRFLQYEPIIQQHFRLMHSLCEQQGFKILQGKN